MKNHLLHMKQLLMEQDTKKLRQYMHETTQHLALSQEFVSSGNHDIDSLLNYKLMSALQLGTEIVTDMRIPADTQIPAFDINVILDNLLDNVPHDGAPLCSHSAERLIHKYFALCLWTPQAFVKGLTEAYICWFDCWA